jgi:serine protease Do
LFNMQGEVIGINTAILSPSGGSIGIGFATPSASVIPVIDQLEKFHETRRGWLGVRIQPVDDSIAESLGLGTARGALVAGVDEKGPAKPAGLQPGDVIVKFDGKDIKESRDLPRLVAEMPVGQQVDVVVIRKGQEVTKQVTLGRLEDGEKTAEASVEPTDDSAGKSATLAAGLDRKRKGPARRRSDRGSQPAGGRDARRRRQGDRGAQGGRQEAGAAAGLQRRRRRSLRHTVAGLTGRAPPRSRQGFFTLLPFGRRAGDEGAWMAKGPAT